ncbi:CHC2 zinc finger domain-containing protein [Runella sp.]|uniref:CHC2 zinc finger domain-containing protein n=1 Tax=Runella sp. TaxID=1960881 RepID=UPI003D0DDCE2
MSITNQQKQKAKDVPIVEWLASKGHQHVKISGGEYVYYSPFNPEENTPSFNVNPAKNCFTDFSTDRKGDSIRLVRELDKVDFVTAVTRLLAFTGFEVMNEPAQLKQREPETPYGVIKKILPLSSQNLIYYFQNRSVNVNIAKEWVNEVHYSTEKGHFYGIGFCNDKGGYEMRCLTRNGNVFKCFVGEKKTITTYHTNDNETVLLFEGFTDFLSYLTYHELTKPYCSAIILNSTAMLSMKVIEELHKYTVVESYLDNDVAGFEAFEKLEKYLCEDQILINASQNLYPNYHDFNDFLQSVPSWQNQRPNSNATKRG